MGRFKLEIKKIENPHNRQLTYSKRSNGLLKKAHELSVLCDIDIAVIMFSQSGELTLFSRNDRVEDVIARFVNTPPHKRAKSRLQNIEYVQKAVPNIHDERKDNEVEDLRAALNATRLQKHFFEQKANFFHSKGSISELSSRTQVMAIEMELEQALREIQKRRKEIENSDAQMSSWRQSTAQDTDGYARPQLMDVSAGENSGQSNDTDVRYHKWLGKRINSGIKERMTSEFLPNDPVSTGMLPCLRMWEHSKDNTDTSTSYFHGGTMSHQYTASARMPNRYNSTGMFPGSLTSTCMPIHPNSTGMLPHSRMMQQPGDYTGTSTSYFLEGIMSDHLTVPARENQMGLQRGKSDPSCFPGPKAETARQFSSGCSPRANGNDGSVGDKSDEKFSGRRIQ